MTRSVIRTLGRISLCSTLAIATSLVVGATPVSAQSFQGTGSGTNGAVITTGVNSTNIALNTGQTVIDWAPTDAAFTASAIGFQYSGTTATFSSASDFAVLNRINPVDISRSIVMDGTINSLVGGQTGGSVFFYSPGGIVVGANAVINVGSLVLTTSPILVDGSGNFINGTTVTFGQAATDTHVWVNPGAQISALNEGSYIALVAPEVWNGGTINVNGAAALVGAEAATINFRTSGLFDIQVTTGTTDINGVRNTGTITGPASSGFGDNHRAYLVAVPKNTAMTMLITAGSNLGFAVAGAADVDGNAVVLSAGHDVSFGSISGESAASGGQANFQLTNANITSALTGDATGYANLHANSASNFESDVTVHAVDHVWVSAFGPGATLDIAGDLTISTDAFGVGEGGSATGGETSLYSQGGAIVTITGAASLSANGYGASSGTAGINGGVGTGGTVLVQAEAGSQLAVGSVAAQADGTGGSAFASGVSGGNGAGGRVFVGSFGTNASLTTGGTTSASAHGTGGSGVGIECLDCNGAGGSGTGGLADVGAFNAGTSLSLAAVDIRAGGFGGAGAGGNNGGSGVGGIARLSASGGADVTSLDVFILADGYGGQAYGLSGVGGSGTGGLGQVFATSGGDITVGGSAYIRSYGSGGSGAVGGVGTGGKPLNGGGAYFSSSSGGSLSITGYAELTAPGQGGYGYVGNGGVGRGGHAEAFANNATLAFGDALYLRANGSGGNAGTLGATTGAGFGGDVYLQAVAAGTVTVATQLYAFAEGEGGSANSGVYSGNGTGGTVTVISRDGGSTLTVAGAAYLNADGEAGYSSECSSSCSNGGVGQGGTINLGSSGALSIDNAVNTLDFGSTLIASADGYGGDSAIIDFELGTVNGGNGIGGTVNLYANDGNMVSVTGDVTLEAIGYGGYDTSDLIGGNGIGGSVQITTNAATTNAIILGATVYLDASGYGGNSGLSGNGAGGDGFGGTARVAIADGTIGIAGDLYANAIGDGGDTFGGTGGNGTGKVAVIFATGGTTTITGSATLDVSGRGGDGLVAGNGLGGGDVITQTNGAHIVAQNATISIGGTANVVSQGDGGNGSDGIGGTGANGTGGFVSINAQNADAGPSSITAALAVLSVDGRGGDGGSGTSGNAGGNGGDGTGGTAAIVASAGNGAVTVDAPPPPELYNVLATATGTGGRGGDGGDGEPGGDGGDGGEGDGGLVVVGTDNANPQALTQAAGVANYGSAFIDASAYGGDGGNGGFGLVRGNGGAGGSAVGGDALLLVRGSTVNVDTALLYANASGGAGGGGTVTGTGGNATGGAVGVVVIERFAGTARGQLNAGTITGRADAFGGPGSINGSSLTRGGSLFMVRNSDATIGSLDFSIAADGVATGAEVNAISIINGDVTVTGDFSFITPGDVSLFADNGSMTAGGTLTLSVGNFVPDTANEPPVSAGTYFANAIDITTNLNIYTTANLDSATGLILNAPGFVTTGNLNGNTGDVLVDAGGFIDVGNIAGGFVNLQASDAVTAGDINSASNIQVQSGTYMILGNLVAGVTIDPQSNKAIRLDSGGSILVGNATALGGIDFDANGSVAGGNLTSGLEIKGDAGGAISFGALSAGLVNPQGPAEKGFSVGISSGTSISVGNVAGAEGIGFATLGSLTTGNLNAGTDVLAMAGGNMSFGAITTGASGRTYLADSSMFIAAGGPDNFDPALVFAATPVASAGSITINGPVSTGRFQAAAGTNLSAGAISAQTIDASAGGTATVSGLWAAPSVLLTSNDIDVTASGGIDAGNSGEVTLQSTNATQALIGDGLSGTGYALSNAEFGRISSGALYIQSAGNALAAQDMLIGDLSITGPLAGSTIDDPNGILVFATGDLVTEAHGGVIRVVGDVVATGFLPGNGIEFYSDLFELDAATGSISVQGSGGALGGKLEIIADRIHIASGTILDKLAVDPQYAGYQDDLNQPAIVQRPDGVISAANIFVYPTEAVLVQNTGTADVPAGFVANTIELFEAEGAQPGSIELIVNGQLVTATGTLTGVAVRDALVLGTDLAVYSENSTINGCALTGDCTFTGPGPIVDPVGGISTEIALFSKDPLFEQPFANDPVIDEGEGDEDKDGNETELAKVGDEASSPIKPPAPLFDTRPLNPDGDIDEPISGSGNPALAGSAPATVPSSGDEK